MLAVLSVFKRIRGFFPSVAAAAAGSLLFAGLFQPLATGAAPDHLLSPHKPAVPRILFIGNSLTAGNDLPAMVEALSAAAGHRVVARAIARGGFSLEDHWNDGAARRAIAGGGWAYVVLQQGPSALPESFVSLRDYTRRFNEVIARGGGKTALYMVWPSKARSGDFDGVSRSYARAAMDVGGLLLPAGDAWRAAWRRDPSLALYGEDQFHPSAAGSWLAALVIVRQISGRSPVGLTVRVSPAPRLGLTAGQVQILEEAAEEAAAAAGRR